MWNGYFPRQDTGFCGDLAYRVLILSIRDLVPHLVVTSHVNTHRGKPDILARPGKPGPGAG